MMKTMSRAEGSRRRYDTSLRRLVHQGRGRELVRDLRIPRSTVSGWKRNRPPTAIGPGDADSETELRAENAKLRRRVAVLTATVALLLSLLRVSRFRLDQNHLVDGDGKTDLLRAVERARAVLPLRSVLRVLRLSSSRYGAWKRGEQVCSFDDVARCPKSRPTQLTPQEIRTMREMATSSEYRHVSTGVLAILAQRLGKVFASPATWRRYVRARGWRRPRRRIHPSAPKTGIRTESPDALWHLDTTVLRLLDGQKVYLRAVVDNCSRRILAWWLGSSSEPTAAAVLLLKAYEGRSTMNADASSPQCVMVDGGIENFNAAVDELVNDGVLKRILAQTEIASSNSMIEAFFRRIKHQWLFLNELDTISTVRRLVAFYVTEYNERLPHSALSGRTPDEAYFGTADDVPDQLARARIEARAARLQSNRAGSCDDCLAAAGA